MGRMFRWQTLRHFPKAAAARGRKPKRRPRSYQPWLDLLERRLAPTVTLSVSNPAPFRKPDTEQMMGIFVVTRSGDLAAPVLVDYYTGTVHFLSIDPNATLPDDYTFTAADQGAHTFAGLVLQTHGRPLCHRLGHRGCPHRRHLLRRQRHRSPGRSLRRNDQRG